HMARVPAQARLVPLGPRPDLEFEARIEALEEAFTGRLGFHAVRLGDGGAVELRAGEVFRTAAGIKVALRCAGPEPVELGHVVHLPPPGSRIAGGGILKQLEVESVSLRDAIELTITLSDNVATNALVELCGVERVNEYLTGIGLAETRLLGPVDFAQIE